MVSIIREKNGCGIFYGNKKWFVCGVRVGIIKKCGSEKWKVVWKRTSKYSEAIGDCQRYFFLILEKD